MPPAPMILTICALFAGTVFSLIAMTGGDLALTSLIVLGWLAASLTLGLLMAKSK